MIHISITSKTAKAIPSLFDELIKAKLWLIAACASAKGRPGIYTTPYRL